MKYSIDAKGKKIGRVASEAAKLLLGKNLVSFARNTAVDAEVEILNASKADVTAKKKTGDVYKIYTGFRGGLKSETLGELMARRGMGEVFRRSVYKMLPKNKLRDIRIKNLTVKE